MSDRVCPFPGLLPFQEKDAPFFFGRDREAGELLARLDQGRFLAVIGVSGSGKSSLVRAGVKPELRYGDQAWRIVEMKPGSGPERRLAESLGTELPRHSFGLADCLRNAGQRVVVIVDQFEEIFSYRKQGTDEAKEADLFVQQLLRASAEPGSPVHVLLTMRTDYLGHCALFRNLPEALNEGTYLVPRLTRQEQEEAIRSPLAVSGVEIDPEVVDELLNLVEANRDELPVLQHLLKRMWEEWAKRGSVGAITRPDFGQTGGWESAIAQDAESVLKDLELSERQAVKRIYQRITQKGTGDRPIRTPCLFADLVELTGAAVTPARLREIIKSFGKRDLLVWDGALQEDSRIDIPHECMTWRWADLASWIEEEDRDRQRLEFIGQSKREGTPLAGSALDEALALQARITGAWVSRYKLDAGELTAHIKDSRRKVDKALKRKDNIVFGLVLALVAFAALGLWVGHLQYQADLAKETLTLQLASRSESVFGREAAGIERATLLATLSMRVQPTLDGDRMLRRELALWPKTLWKTTDAGPVRAVAFSPDGKWVVTGGDDKTGRVMDAETGKERCVLQHEGPVRAMAFSPDGKWVATGSEDNTARVMDAATGKERCRLQHERPVLVVAFSPDGKWVATGSEDNTARVMNAETGKERWRLKHKGPVLAVAVSPDGKWVATGSRDQAARVMGSETGKEKWRVPHEGAVTAVAFSPDSKWVAMGSDDWTARVMEAATGKEVSRLRHEGGVNAVVFSPDGQYVATGSDDKTARVMKAATGKEISRLAHEGDVNAVAFSRDSRYVATGSDDKTARVMEAVTGAEVSRLLHGDGVDAVAFSPDGKWVATGSRDHTVRVMEAAKGMDGFRLNHEGTVTALAFNQDGKYVATGSDDQTAHHTVRVLDVVTGTEVSRWGHEGVVRAVAFSPDSTRVATGSDEKKPQARVFEMKTGKEVWRLEHKGVVLAVAFSPDSKWLATGSSEYAARVIDAATGKERRSLPHDGEVNGAVFSRDSNRVATGSDDRKARVFEVKTGKEVSRLIHGSGVDAVAFSPDGKWVATGSYDYSARVMDVATGTGVPRLMHEGIVRAVAFSPDGKWVATGSDDKTVGVMDRATGKELHRIDLPGVPLAVRFSDNGLGLDMVQRASYGNDLIYAHHSLEPQDLIREACEKVTRNLTVTEWDQYAGAAIPYRRSCENLPLPPDYK